MRLSQSRCGVLQTLPDGGWASMVQGLVYALAGPCEHGHQRRDLVALGLEELDVVIGLFRLAIAALGSIDGVGVLRDEHLALGAVDAAVQQFAQFRIVPEPGSLVGQWYGL